MYSNSGSAQASEFSQDSLQFMMILDEGFAAARKDSTEAMLVYQRAQVFADSTGHSYFELKTQRLFIYYMENWGLVEEADSLYDIMIRDAQKYEDEQNLYSAYAGKASLFYRLGKHGQALEFYFKAVEIAEKRKDSLNLSKIYNNLSLVQNKLDDHEGSAQTLRKAIRLKQALKDSMGLADNYVNLGNLHAQLLRQDSALKYYDLAGRLYRILGDSVDAQLLTSNIGELYYKLEQFELAAIYIDSSLVIRETMPPSLSYLINLSYRGGIHNHQGEHSKALERYKIVEDILGGQNYAPVLKEVYKGKADAFSGLGEYERAYQNLALLREVEKELNEASELELQEKYEAIFLIKEKENELKLNQLELDSEKGRTRLWTIIGAAAILLFILAGVLAIVNRRRNQALGEKNALVTKSLRDREVLLREIHHRVKNNLQIVSSMLSIQGRRTKDDEARAGMLDSQNRVKSMSLIHEHLYRDEHLSHVNMSDYVQKLLTNVQQSYRDMDVKIEKDIADLKLDIDTAVSLGLILNEAVTNSMKHAFANSTDSLINVNLKKDNDQIILEVADNGSGFDQTDRKSRSFGMTMMEAFTESLEGSFEVDSNQGTRLQFRFKAQAAA